MAVVQGDIALPAPTATWRQRVWRYLRRHPTLIFGGVLLLIMTAMAVFAIPGLGRLTVDAILRRDYPIIQGIILVFSAAYVLINLLVDLSYTLLDPRIRY